MKKIIHMNIRRRGLTIVSVFLVVMSMGVLLPSASETRSEWSIETVDYIGFVGKYTSLALDSSGYPHISYYDDTMGDLKYAYQDAGGWHTVTLENTGDAGRYTSLALDSNDYPHISYIDAYNFLKYAYQDGSGWIFNVVDSSCYCGYTSLALDSSDYPHISYYDSSSTSLRYAYYSGSGWLYFMVDDIGDAGRYTSLALDSNDYPHISYYDQTNTDLQYAYMDGGGWHIVMVDGVVNDVGIWTSITLDTDDYPHISYRDSTYGDLKYVYQSSVGWHTDWVDDTGDVGYYTSLSLDTNDYPHISYYDSTNDDLKYAYQDAGGWHISTVDSTGSVGGYTSIALDNDYPRISYYDGSNGDLKYAWIEQPTVDYVSITLADGTEINNQALAPKFSLECYAAAFNATYGHLGFIDCSWNRVNSGGSNASLNATTGSRVKLYTGWYDGTVTLSIDDGSGHSDSVVFTIDQSAFSMVINRGWNLIGWLQGYATDAETLGQYIPGCTVVCKFDSNSQSYSTHVVGIPYNEFIITGGMGVFIYTTEASIWDGTDGTI